MADIKLAEKELSNYFGRQHAILCGRAATALWAIFSCLSPERSKVIVPATLCLSPIFSVLYAGKTPVFCDVSKTGNLDICKVQEILESDEEVGAVLAVHLYGIPIDIDRLGQICSNYNALLVEDVCQAMGGKDETGKLLGSKGQVSVFSFGHTKILELGNGGAVLTDDADIAENVKKQLFKVKEEDPGSLSCTYSNLFYPIWNAGRTDPQFYRFFHMFPEIFKPLYFKNISEELPNKLLKNLPLLENIVNQRNNTAEIYKKHLCDVSMIRTLSKVSSGVVWRYTFTVPENIRDGLVKMIRDNGFDASTWYPCVVDWFSSSKAPKTARSDFPTALKLENEIVNLWVTPDYHADRIEKLTNFIQDHLANNSTQRI